MQILTFSSLYPNEVDPVHGIFVERRLVEVLRGGTCTATVVSPVPWFPFRSPVFGRYAAMARTSIAGERLGIEIRRPRYPVIPKIGMNLSARLMERACRACVREVATTRGADLIDAHYFYPDGVAAVRLGERLGLPVVITARGSDVNRIAGYRGPLAQMRRAADYASAIVAVSGALADRMTALGLPQEKIHVIRNGVDLEFFDPSKARQRVRGSDGPHFLSVGKLIPEKGHDLAIDFVAGLPGARLAIAGAGPDEDRLRQRAARSDAADRVDFLGQLAPDELRDRYCDSDALILMSAREGMPNVVLESLACGTPVLATNVGGVPEILTESVAGRLVDARRADALAAAWSDWSGQPSTRADVRAFAARYTWSESATRLLELFRGVQGGLPKRCDASHK